MDDPLVCKLCGQLYNDPLLLSCGHSCCAKCVDHMIAFTLLRTASATATAPAGTGTSAKRKPGTSCTKVEISCPTCSCTTEVDAGAAGAPQQNAVHSLRRNRDLADEIERRRSSAKALLCQLDCGRPATAYCARCSNTLFCADCFRVQHSTGVFKTHEPRPLEPALLSFGLAAAAVTCPEHTTQELALFCLVCRRPVCLICAQFSKAHKGHECAALVEHAEDCRRRIAAGLAELERRRSAVAAALDASASRRAVSGQALQEARDEIAAAFDKLESALRQRREELLRLLDSVAEADNGLQHALQDTADFIAGLQARYAPLAQSRHDVAVAVAAHDLDAQLRKCEIDTNALQAHRGRGLVTTARVRIHTDNVIREIRAIGFIERTLSIGGDIAAEQAVATANAAAAATITSNTTTTTTTSMWQPAQPMPIIAVSRDTESAAVAASPPGLSAAAVSAMVPSSASASVATAASMQMLATLRFHPTQHGPYAIVSDSGRRAMRANPLDTYNNAVVTLSDPLLPGMPRFFEVVINDVSRKWAGSLSLRFATELVQPLPPCIQTNLMETFGIELAVGDRVGLGLDGEGRSLLYVRGKCLGHVTMFGTLPTDRPLFACVDLYGKVSAVTINIPSAVPPSL